MDSLNPKFDFSQLQHEVDKLANEYSLKTKQKPKPVKHKEILSRLIQQLKKTDFRDKAGFENGSEKLAKKHFLITCVEEVLAAAKCNDWGLCRHNNTVYLYNGAYWSPLDSHQMQDFLGEAAEKMGVDKFDARHYLFREQLFKQFLATANLPKPEPPKDTVLINLQNGTFEVTPEGHQLRPTRREDFLTYQLPFEHAPEAEAPLFEAYLNQVQPDINRQQILAEYLGSVFIATSTLKLEKTLLLFGSGANGKSVFFEIVNALLGTENVSSFSLQSLTNENGYFRAKLGDKLLNYASEINGNLEASIFKQMVSGEPLEARLPYGEPLTITNYAKLIFNCNELPKDVEQTNAFFRRFLIVPFDVTIAEAEQDKELSKKIIEQELSGVFNWVLKGLQRLLQQKRFTDSEAVRQQLEQYRKQSDSVQMFLEDEQYLQDTSDCKPLKDLFQEYKTYCGYCNYRTCSMKTFSDRLKKAGFHMERKNYGQAVFISKKVLF